MKVLKVGQTFQIIASREELNTLELALSDLTKLRLTIEAEGVAHFADSPAFQMLKEIQMTQETTDGSRPKTS